MAKKKVRIEGVGRELEREIGAIVKKVEAIKKVEGTPEYKKLNVLEESEDLYGVVFSTENRDEIIAKAALARFLIAVARYFDVPPETIIQVKNAEW